MDQIVPASGHASLFIPFNFVDSLEVFRICRGSVADLALPQCSTDEDCKTATGDAASVCGGDGTCLIRRWCPLPGRSTKHDLSATLSDIQYEVIARLKPYGKSQIYSNYKSALEGQEEVCISCRFEPMTVLDLLTGRQAEELSALMSSGVELEHTFHWQCPTNNNDDRYSCNVWTDQTVTRNRFAVSSATVPVSRGNQGEVFRRRVTFYGMNILFRGEVQTKEYAVYPIFNFICQMFGLVIFAGYLGTSLSFLLPGGGRRSSFAQEAYAENLHNSLQKVVQLKKAVHVDLQGLTDQRLHQRVKEDVEILSGLDFNDPKNRLQVSSCIDALNRNQGDAVDAAIDLGTDIVNIENMRSLAEAVRLGPSGVKRQHMDLSCDSNQGTESTRESV